MQEELRSALNLRDIRSNQNGIRADLLAMGLLTNRQEQEALETDIKARAGENNVILRTLQDLKRTDARFLSRLEEFNSRQGEFEQTRDTQVIPLIYQGKKEAAQGVILGIQEERNQRMRSIADDLIKESEESVQSVVAQAEQTADRSIRVFLSVGFLALLVSIVMGASLNRIIANPLKEISGAAEKNRCWRRIRRCSFQPSQR